MRIMKLNEYITELNNLREVCRIMRPYTRGMTSVDAFIIQKASSVESMLRGRLSDVLGPVLTAAVDVSNEICIDGDEFLNSDLSAFRELANNFKRVFCRRRVKTSNIIENKIKIKTIRSGNKLVLTVIGTRIAEVKSNKIEMLSFSEDELKQLSVEIPQNDVNMLVQTRMNEIKNEVEYGHSVLENRTKDLVDVVKKYNLALT